MPTPQTAYLLHHCSAGPGVHSLLHFKRQTQADIYWSRSVNGKKLTVENHDAQNQFESEQ